MKYADDEGQNYSSSREGQRLTRRSVAAVSAAKPDDRAVDFGSGGGLDVGEA
jgi:hypothetical protein